MPESPRTSKPDSPPGVEKRAFTRNAICLDGKCGPPERVDCDIRILDFCLGGVYLSFSRRDSPIPSCGLVRGEVIDIRCSVPRHGAAVALVFKGRVVRVDRAGAGVAFIAPSFEALEVLHEYAKNNPCLADGAPASAEGTAATGIPRIGAAGVRSIVAACRETAEERMDRIATVFLDRVKEHLFSTAGEVHGVVEKNAYYTALAAYNRDGEAFKNEFLSRLALRFSTDPSQVASPIAAPAHDADAPLALVEENAFEDWLAFTDMARATELEHREALAALELRLGTLFRMTVGKDNDPFGPGAISQVFQDALRTLALEHKMAEDSCRVFKDVLCAEAGGLYEALNQRLIESGVLPVLKARDVFKPTGGGGTPRPPANASAVRAKESAPPAEAAPSPPPAPPPVPEGSPPPAAQDWYGLMKGLGHLRELLAVQGPLREGGAQAAPAAGGAVAEASPPPRYFTSEELIDALSRVDMAARTAPAEAGFSQDFKNRLLATLAEAAADGRGKALPGRETNILEIGGGLFDSLLSDKLVAKTVKPWLKQLSIPIIKLALKDDSLFFDESHLARQLINLIAELELYGEGGKLETVVKKKIDHVLDEISAAPEITRELLLRMLREVGALVHIQHKAYEENLRDVYSECEAGDGGASLKATGGAAKHAQAPGKTDEDAELREWKKRARRLRPGNWLLLDQDSVSKRLRLAWVAKDRDRYVFVNVQGLREATLSQDELARQLRDGSAVVLDDAGERVVDRAQSAMLQKMHHQLLHETSHDLLTGLINRREFEKRLAAALAKARQSGTRSAICYLDLNEFSVVNSTFGYEGGDRMLAEVTALLKDALGERGVLSRIGGDEFAMLLEDCAMDEALGVMARQKEAFESYRFTKDHKTLSISFSAGLVALEPDSESVTALLQAAEACCRIARTKGTNHVQVYSRDEADVSRHLQSIQWVSRIDEALDHDSLELRCQPIVSIAGKNVAVDHFEVLLGVPDGKGNLLSPVDFIMAAEHYRRMASVDRWVVEHAFRWLVDRRERMEELGSLAINLSGASLNEEGLIDFVLHQAESINVPMDKICFEITETAGITHLSDATEFILQLKKSGCSFSLDDFGSGLSSYAYLKHLPVDYLKIDGAFVEKMDQNPYDLAVVKSITEIGHFMGKKIIAERVENEAVLKILREMGVDYAQGYFVGKPRRMRVMGSL